MSNEQGQHFNLKIPGNPKYVGVVRLAVSGLASRLNFSYEDVEDIKLAVAEGCARAITHGKGQEIVVECQILDKALLISILDNGKGPPDEDDLGIFLIRSLMDETTYQLSDGQRCRLIMKKNFQKKN